MTYFSWEYKFVLVWMKKKVCLLQLHHAFRVKSFKLLHLFLSNTLWWWRQFHILKELLIYLSEMHTSSVLHQFFQLIRILFRYILICIFLIQDDFLSSILEKIEAVSFNCIVYQWFDNSKGNNRWRWCRLLSPFLKCLGWWIVNWTIFIIIVCLINIRH